VLARRHVALGKLMVFYDDNGISIDGETRGWFTDDTQALRGLRLERHLASTVTTSKRSTRQSAQRSPNRSSSFIDCGQ
jgi:transketolase